MTDMKLYEDRAALEVGQCYVEDLSTGRVRFTQKGRTEYTSRFGKAGIDINTIHTMAQLKSAWDRSQWVGIEEIRNMVAGHPELEKVLAPILK